MKKSLLPILLSIFLATSPLAGKELPQIEQQTAALITAQRLPQTGVLKQEPNGYVYLDVSNAFVNTVGQKLDIPGQLRLLPTSSRSIGAHISVFNEREGIDPIELGEEFSFAVEYIKSFTLHTRDGLKKLWVITVHSKELEALRLHYDCSARLKGHDFHITLGKQVPTAPQGWETVQNVSAFDESEENTLDLTECGDFVTVEHSAILATATKLHALGQLKLKGNGFVYLDVDNAYVDDSVTLLPIEGPFNPVSTQRRQMGAHISVIYEDEMIGHGIWELAQAGEWFHFEVKELRYVDRISSKGKERLWLLAVDAPGLQRLRRSYGLKPKLQGYDFHITIGRESRENIEKEEIPAAA